MKRNQLYIIIVLIILFVGRLTWVVFWKFGEYRYLDSPDKYSRAQVTNYTRPAFWGGLITWTEFKVETNSGYEIWSEQLFHPGFELDWRSSGNIEWVSPTIVKFTHINSNVKNKNILKKLVVVINIDEI